MEVWLESMSCLTYTPWKRTGRQGQTRGRAPVVPSLIIRGVSSKKAARVAAAERQLQGFCTSCSMTAWGRGVRGSYGGGDPALTDSVNPHWITEMAKLKS